MLWVVLTGVALVVILGLGFYAGRLLFLLKQQKKRKNDATNARVANITESIILISKAMEQQQCDLSEGVIRIVNLLNALPLNNPPDFKAKFPHTHALFVAISGFAVLEARQQLSKQERRKQDKAREQIESEYESKVLDELPGVKTFCEALV